MKTITVAVLLLLSIATSAQQLRIKKGEIYNANLEKLDTRQVRFLLAKHPDLLKKYDAYRNKSTFGGIFLGAGVGLLATDLALGLMTDTQYPTVATYIGGAMTVASIPILMGRKNKLETAIEGYNKQIANGDSSFEIDQINFVANQNGAGIQLTF